MLHNTYVQAKVQREVDEVIGQSRLPKWSDHVNMHHNEAFIMETQHLGDIIPFGALHAITEDTLF